MAKKTTKVTKKTAAAATSRRPHRIMAFDGGGIRGIMTAVWLARLERELGGRLRDHADLLAGTSTGSILACALSLGIPAEKIVQLYQEKGRVVFPSTASRLWSRAGRLFTQGPSAPKYDGEGLAEALQEEFGEDTRMKALAKPTLVTSYDTLNRQALVFKSMKTEHQSLKVWEVVKASSSAPTYFPAHVMKVGKATLPLVDGGVVANNPTVCALAEGVRRAKRPLDEFRVASFGTGVSTRAIGIDEATEWGALEWAVPVIGVLMDGAADAVEYIATQLLPPSNYVRMQTPLDTAFDDMDDASRTNINALVAVAENYLDRDGGVELDRILHWLR